MKALFVLTFSLLILCACDDYEMSGEVFQDDDMLSTMYMNAVDTLSIDNQHYIIETELVIINSGSASSNAIPLWVFFDFREVNQLTVDPELDIKFVYVINGKNMWRSVPAKSEQYSRNFELRFESGEGPEWNSGTIVNVMVVIENKQYRQPFYLISRNQVITEIN